MSAARRRAEVVWKGDLASGSGKIVSSGSGALQNLDVSWADADLGEADGKTSPEELIAAAHASCFSMALSERPRPGRAMRRSGFDVSAVVSFEQVEGGWKIASREPDVARHRAGNGRGRVSGGLPAERRKAAPVPARSRATSS